MVIFIFWIALKTSVIESITTFFFFLGESRGKFGLIKSQNTPQEAKQMTCHRLGEFRITEAAFCLVSSGIHDFHVLFKTKLNKTS